MAALTVDFREHSGPTPADDMAAQIITDYGIFTLDFMQHEICACTLPPDSGTLFPNERQNLLSSQKRTLDHWVLFSAAQVRRFWRCLWFRSGLVALSWRRLSVVTLDALTPASVQSLWSSPKCLNQLCLTVFSSLSHPCCLCTFSYPNSSFQSTLHLICFDYSTL